MALIRRTAATRRHLVTYQLARVFWFYQYRTGRQSDCLEAQELALVAADALGDFAAAGAIYNYRAGAYFRTGRSDQALADLAEAARCLRSAGIHDRMLAGVLCNQSMVLKENGRLDEARAAAAASAAEWDLLGDAVGRAVADSVVGEIDMLLRRFDSAIEPWRRVLRLARASGENFRRGLALGNLGQIELGRGRYRLAVRMLQRARLLQEEVAAPFLQALLLTKLAEAHCGLGEFELARGFHQQALRLVEGSGDASETQVRIGFGATLRGAGDGAGALEQYRIAVRLAQQCKARRELGLALDGLASALEPTDVAGAVAHWRRAYELLRELGLPEADEVAARLAAAQAGLDQVPRTRLPMRSTTTV